MELLDGLRSEDGVFGTDILGHDSLDLLVSDIFFAHFELIYDLISACYNSN